MESKGKHISTLHSFKTKKATKIYQKEDDWGVTLKQEDGAEIYLDSSALITLGRIIDLQSYREDVKAFLIDNGLEERIENKKYLEKLTERYADGREDINSEGGHWQDALQLAFEEVAYEEYKNSLDELLSEAKDNVNFTLSELQRITKEYPEPDDVLGLSQLANGLEQTVCDLREEVRNLEDITKEWK